MVAWGSTMTQEPPSNINGYLHSRTVGSSSRRSVRRRFFGSMIPMRNVTAASESAVIFNGLGHQGLADASGIGICWVMSGNEIGVCSMFHETAHISHFLMSSEVI